MKRAALISITVVALLASRAIADSRGKSTDIALGEATDGTNTISGLVGYLEEVQVLVTDGVSTGSVVVSIQPTDSTVAAYNIATNTVIDEKRWIPRRDATDVSGTDLTGDPPQRYYLSGDTLNFIVTGSVSNKTWRLRVKTSEP